MIIPALERLGLMPNSHAPSQVATPAVEVAPRHLCLDASVCASFAVVGYPREVGQGWQSVPMVHASAQYNYGYVLTVLPGQTACFLCAFPDLPTRHSGSVPVLGIATGIAGCLGAGEVIKIVVGVGRPIVDGHLTFSAFPGSFDFIPTPRRPDCPACGTPDRKPYDPSEPAPLR